MPIKKCSKCGSYTLRNECQKCETKTKSPAPAKYSPEDKYGEYRRKEKLNNKQ